MNERELRSLGEAAAKKNQQNSITGFLMVSGGLFYQVLEGPEEKVDEIYAAIAADDRHTDLLMLRSEGNVTGRLFPDWSMKTINLDASSNQLLTNLVTNIRAIMNHNYFHVISSRTFQLFLTMILRTP